MSQSSTSFRRATFDVASLIRLLRPEQWVKNVFIAAGVLFGARFGDPQALRAMLFAFAAFCLMGSSVYVLNDYIDRESDRVHPKKKHRPLASGSVTTAQAFCAAGLCLAGSLILALSADYRVLVIVLLYLAINTAYSLRLKQMAVVDVFCIGSGFMLRIMAGTWGIHIPPSGWLILTGLFAALFLGFSKRRAEWMDAAGNTQRRRVLNDYTQPLLDSFLSITAAGTALCYGLYTLDPNTVALHHTDKLIYTMPFVLFGMFRYLFILHTHHKGENPSVDVFADPQILACGAAYGAAAVWLLNR
jgi:4-hydroxybenzoate polyprenyltransferase